MFERYTEKARRVIFFARYEASLVGSAAIEPEDLLLGLLREDLHHLPFNTIREEIENLSPRKKKPIHTSVELPLSNAAKRALAYAHEECDRLGHRHIGTDHLLLGLLRQECIAAQVLHEHGVSLEALREEVSGCEVASSPQAVKPGSIRFGILEENHVSFADNLLSGRITTGMTAESLRQQNRKILLGVEKLLEEYLDLVKGERVGLICNQASVDHGFRHVADLFHSHPEINLTALFGPQHGIRGDVQDNMIETEHAVDQQTNLPVHSLYSETREPTEEMLKNVDVLVFDMQDVGCRIYTFAYTMANCMRAAKKFGKRVIVCDRPNPINGTHVAGNVLEPEQASFVGQFPMPTRHGMTMGELAQLFNVHFNIGCDLAVVLMEGWKREYWYDETDGPWVMPSPNMPSLEAATVFPGTVHFEGTQLSEGRGTTRPFELVGAPYVVPEAYAKELNALELPGVFFRSCVFQPTFQKHAGVGCGGVQIHVLDREMFEPVLTGIALVKTAFDMYPDQFRWKEPPYEYVYDRNPFDVIAGTTKIREAFEAGRSLDQIEESWKPDLERFMELRSSYVLY